MKTVLLRQKQTTLALLNLMLPLTFIIILFAHFLTQFYIHLVYIFLLQSRCELQPILNPTLNPTLNPKLVIDSHFLCCYKVQKFYFWICFAHENMKNAAVKVEYFSKIHRRIVRYYSSCPISKIHVLKCELQTNCT